jgi:uncharacterized flavoprotein (TIGR03862 family)
VTRSAAVVGGGPAGLMAAEVLATAGVAVTVYEHMPSIGRKLLLAGRTGLNITHHEPIETMVSRYRVEDDHVAAALASFGPTELRAWCASLGQPTFVGSTGQVFPESWRATPLLRAWINRLTELGVSINARRRWLGWDGGRLLFASADGTTEAVTTGVTVLALGGASWPRVGSDGTWVDLVRNAGVLVHDLRPSNCGMRIGWTTHFAGRFAGVPMKNIAIAVGDTRVRGDAMVTSHGIEGGPVYVQSAAIRDVLDRDGRCPVTVDLQPDLTTAEVRARLAGGRPKDSIASLLRHTLALAPCAVSLLREATANRVPTDPDSLADLVKAVPLTIEATMPIDRAISSAGGIAMCEIDDAFMLRRLPGTFVAGEMLDWDAPTGGYLLQASFSTAVAAARGALAWLADDS